jgi:hypothetical protein
MAGEPLSPGGQELLRRLRSGDPRAVIEAFQRERGLRAPGGEAALELLRLLGVSRGDALDALLRAQRERLEQQLQRASRESKLRLLEQSFEALAVPELREVPAQLLCELDPLPSPLLARLAALSPQLLSQLPLAARRKAWEARPEIFQQEMEAALGAYSRDAARWEAGHRWSPRVETAAALPAATLDDATPQRRRQRDAQLQQVLALVGESKVLYQAALALLRVHFGRALEAQDAGAASALCALRLDMPLALREREGDTLHKQDPLVPLAALLDTATRERSMPDAVARDISALLRAVPAGHPFAGEAAMAANHPLVRKTLLQAVVMRINECAQRSASPREAADVACALQLLALAAELRVMTRTRAFRIPAASPALQRLPLLLAELRVARELGERAEPVLVRIAPLLEDAAAPAAPARDVVGLFALAALRAGLFSLGVPLLAAALDGARPERDEALLHSVGAALAAARRPEAMERLRAPIIDARLMPLAEHSVVGEFMMPADAAPARSSHSRSLAQCTQTCCASSRTRRPGSFQISTSRSRPKRCASAARPRVRAFATPPWPRRSQRLPASSRSACNSPGKSSRHRRSHQHLSKRPRPRLRTRWRRGRATRPEAPAAATIDRQRASEKRESSMPIRPRAAPCEPIRDGGRSSMGAE